MALIVPTAIVATLIGRARELVEEEVVMLLGVKGEFKNLMRKLEKIRLVLDQAGMRELEDVAIRMWLNQLRELMLDAEDLFDDCSTFDVVQTRKSSAARWLACVSSPLACFNRTVVHGHDVGTRIKSINAGLEQIHKEREQLMLVPTVRIQGFTPATVVRRLPETSEHFTESDVVGIDDDADRLVDLLTGENGRVFAITGMGGVGKTTLARKVFHDARIQSKLEVKIWVCVSRDFSGTDLLKKIIRCAGKSYGEAQSKGELQSKLGEEALGQRSFLLVLDDMWSSQLWEEFLRSPLRGTSTESRVLITTRHERVAMEMGAVDCHQMKLMSSENGWLMLMRSVVRDGNMEEVEGLRNIGLKIVEKCKHLPLSIEAVGGVLRARGDQRENTWEEVLQSQAWRSTSVPHPALLVSYDDLSVQLKLCFLYCSLFPEDFEFSQNYVIRLWIAERLLNSETDSSMVVERSAYDSFKELVARSLFHVVSNKYDGMVCKVHDELRFLALSFMKNGDSLVNLGELENPMVKPRRLSIVNRELKVIPQLVLKQACLRTLLLSRNPLEGDVSDDLFSKLTRIRVLDLSHTGIKSLPKSLSKLVHLSLLNLAFTQITELPVSIGGLQNLQTLDLYWCTSLKTLPEGIAQLCNLRHLDIEAIAGDHTPLNVKGLEHLHTLHGFVVKNGSNNMEELKSLSQLRSLKIWVYGAVSVSEAKEAALKEKAHLKQLWCLFSYRDDEQFGVEMIEQVFKELSPPGSIEKISVSGYFGNQFPVWTSDASLLRNLTYLELGGCSNCAQLPALEKLPHLRNLEISAAFKVRNIGSESHDMNEVAFPKLETLRLAWMDALEGWGGLGNGAFPRLKSLKIERCPKLRLLPEGLKHCTSFRELDIDTSGSLTTIKGLASVRDIKITRNIGLQVISDLPALQSLTIMFCSALREMTNVGNVTKKNLRILLRESMESLPAWVGQVAVSLQRLNFEGTDDLLRRCLPMDGPDWPKIEPISHVDATQSAIDGSPYFSYTKHPTNLIPT
ncbi:putative disease resistance protein [Acorus calamus]|uniref:Disease resistance protein n=1 Tax=Acorus calamus TaxID=4465 RepID=A0AAV9C2Y5_ACOCL|nr:putative disease resistance protein [Acorus calamus]